MWLVKLTIMAVYTYGAYDSAVWFTSMDRCLAYKTQLEAHPNGAFNGSVSSAKFSCSWTWVSTGTTLP